MNFYIQPLQQIDIFDFSKNINNILFIKSTFRNSSKLSAIKTDKGTLKFRNDTIQDENGQAYLDFVFWSQEKVLNKIKLLTKK